MAPADGRRPRGGYVLAEASAGTPAGDPHRHRLRGAARRRGARERLEADGHPDPRRVDAVRRVVRRAGRRPTASRCCPPSVRARVSRRGRRRDRRGTSSSATPAGASASSTSGRRRTPRRCSASSASPSTPSSRRPTRASTDDQGLRRRTHREEHGPCPTRPIARSSLRANRQHARARRPGRLGLARRPQPGPARHRRAGRAGRPRRRRRHDQPDDLRGGPARQRRLRRPGRATWPPAASTSRRPSRMITTYDVRWACDVLRAGLRPRRPAWTAGCPSRSTRARPATPRRPSPRPAGLWWLVDRPNLFIKIPATLEGLPAITAGTRGRASASTSR